MEFLFTFVLQPAFDDNESHPELYEDANRLMRIGKAM